MIGSRDRKSLQCSQLAANFYLDYKITPPRGMLVKVRVGSQGSINQCETYESSKSYSQLQQSRNPVRVSKVEWVSNQKEFTIF